MSPASLFVVALGIVLTLPIGARIAQRRFDPFEPIVLFVLAYGTMFVARPAHMLLTGSLSYGGVDLRAAFPVACALALVGGTAFVCGYELGAGAALARRLPAPREVSTRGAVPWVAVLTAISASLLVLVLSRSTGLSGIRRLFEGRVYDLAESSAHSSYLWFGIRLVVPAAICLFALALRERRRSLIVLAAAVTALSLLVTLPLGNRVFLLPLLGAFFVLPYLSRDRRPGPLLLAAVALAAILVSFAIGVLRDPDRKAQAGTEVMTVLREPHTLLDPILVGNDAEMAPVLAGALTAIPDPLGYRYGRATFGEIVIRPIPREFWGGKPTAPDEKIVAEVWPGLAGIFHPVFTPLIFLYWDFGIVGVFLGMALFGVASRSLYEWFVRSRGAFAAQVIFATALWYVVIAVRNHPAETLALSVFVLGPLVVLERISGRRLALVTSRRAPAEPQP